MFKLSPIKVALMTFALSGNVALASMNPYLSLGVNEVSLKFKKGYGDSLFECRKQSVVNFGVGAFADNGLGVEASLGGKLKYTLLDVDITKYEYFPGARINIEDKQNYKVDSSLQNFTLYLGYKNTNLFKSDSLNLVTQVGISRSVFEFSAKNTSDGEGGEPSPSLNRSIKKYATVPVVRVGIQKDITNNLSCELGFYWQDLSRIKLYFYNIDDDRSIKELRLKADKSMQFRLVYKI